MCEVYSKKNMVAAEKVNICNMRVEKDGKGVQGESALSGGREGESAATNIDNHQFVREIKRESMMIKTTINSTRCILTMSKYQFVYGTRKREGGISAHDESVERSIITA